MESLTHDIETLINQFKKNFVLKVIEEFELDISPTDALKKYDIPLKNIKKAKKENAKEDKVMCKGFTKKGKECSKKAGENGYCCLHKEHELTSETSEPEIQEKKEKVKCNGVTKKGNPCSKKAGENGYCKVHTPTETEEATEIAEETDDEATEIAEETEETEEEENDEEE